MTRLNMSFCQKCGTEAGKDALYCEKCGNPLSAITERGSDKRSEREGKNRFPRPSLIILVGIGGLAALCILAVIVLLARVFLFSDTPDLVKSGTSPSEEVSAAPPPSKNFSDIPSQKPEVRAPIPDSSTASDDTVKLGRACASIIVNYQAAMYKSLQETMSGEFTNERLDRTAKVVKGYIAIARSNFGKEVLQKCDSQLVQLHEAYLDKIGAEGLLIARHPDVSQENRERDPDYAAAAVAAVAAWALELTAADSESIAAWERLKARIELLP